MSVCVCVCVCGHKLPLFSPPFTKVNWLTAVKRAMGFQCCWRWLQSCEKDAVLFCFYLTKSAYKFKNGLKDNIILVISFTPVPTLLHCTVLTTLTPSPSTPHATSLLEQFFKWVNWQLKTLILKLILKLLMVCKGFTYKQWSPRVAYSEWRRKTSVTYQEILENIDSDRETRSELSF